MMLISLFLAFFLPCVGMSAVFVVYICLLWYASNRSSMEFGAESDEKSKEKGLSIVDLEKMGSIVADEAVKGQECAVCLDDIEIGQVVRFLPDCHHGFHVQCADAWLSKHPVCPLCRANLGTPDEKKKSCPPLSPLAPLPSEPPIVVSVPDDVC